jgi:predicted Zn-dependent protease
MLIRPAEDSFRQGLDALANGKRLEAPRLRSLDQPERQFGVERAQPRYASYYGLCLGLESRKFPEALALCREAAEAEFYSADLHLNLARVLIAGGRRAEARDAILRGLRWESSHPVLQRELRAMGSRRKPVLPFLSRRHPINVFLGRITYAPQPRRRAA